MYLLSCYVAVSSPCTDVSCSLGEEVSPLASLAETAEVGWAESGGLEEEGEVTTTSSSGLNEACCNDAACSKRDVQILIQLWMSLAGREPWLLIESAGTAKIMRLQGYNYSLVPRPLPRFQCYTFSVSITWNGGTGLGMRLYTFTQADLEGTRELAFLSRQSLTVHELLDIV